MTYPDAYKYSKDHEWLKIEGDTGTIGITHHAQDQLGDVVFVELPEVGRQLDKGDVFGVVESVKAVVDCYMPMTGEIIEINDELDSKADNINSDPHGAGWMVKFKFNDLNEANDLLTKAQYEAFLSEEA